MDATTPASTVNSNNKASIRRKANDVKTTMARNHEVLIQGLVPGDLLVSESYYQNDPGIVAGSTILPPGAGSASVALTEMRKAARTVGVSRLSDFSRTAAAASCPSPTNHAGRPSRRAGAG